MSAYHGGRLARNERLLWHPCKDVQILLGDVICIEYEHNYYWTIMKILVVYMGILN